MSNLAKADLSESNIRDAGLGLTKPIGKEAQINLINRHR